MFLKKDSTPKLSECLFDGFNNKLSTQSTLEYLVQPPSFNRDRDPEVSVWFKVTQKLLPGFNV